MSLRARRSDRDGIFSGNEPDRAIIDIGSNTVRMVLYGGSPRAPVTLFNEKVTAKLGRDVASQGVLAEEALDLALRGLRRYTLMLQDLGITDIECVATAAAREASNGPQFLDDIRAMGLEPRLLPGVEEGRVSAMGILGAFPGAKGVAADVGGGSLELAEVSDGACGDVVSLPLGTLRLPELQAAHDGALYPAVASMLENAGWHRPADGALYLVGGTWRAMAVYAMQDRDYPLSDPHGFELSAAEGLELARAIEGSNTDDLMNMPRMSSMRAASLPDAAILLRVLLDVLQPDRIVFSSWGLRDGLLFDRLEPSARRQDPLLAGVAQFGALRGAPPTLATRIAGWSAPAVPAGQFGSERLRLAATTLALASMQIEPNLRSRQAIEWGLQKRWIGVDAWGRAMLAAAIAANGNSYALPSGVADLVPEGALTEAYGWGLAVRLARRLGGRSRKSLENSALFAADGILVLALRQSHADLFGLHNEKDLDLLADQLGLTAKVTIVPEDAPLRPAATER